MGTTFTQIFCAYLSMLLFRLVCMRKRTYMGKEYLGLVGIDWRLTLTILQQKTITIKENQLTSQKAIPKVKPNTILAAHKKIN